MTCEEIDDGVMTGGGAVGRFAEDRGQRNQWMEEQRERWVLTQELGTGIACIWVAVRGMEGQRSLRKKEICSKRKIGSRF